jgi:hypothetical protein
VSVAGGLASALARSPALGALTAEAPLSQAVFAPLLYFDVY